MTKLEREIVNKWLELRVRGYNLARLLEGDIFRELESEGAIYYDGTITDSQLTGKTLKKYGDIAL